MFLDNHSCVQYEKVEIIMNDPDKLTTVDSKGP